MPYQVGLMSDGKYKVFNFGFDGYGAEQMLAATESGMVRRVVDTNPKYAFYVAIPNHVWRVAGRTAWGEHAPRYVLDSNGTPRQTGHFEDREALGLRLGLGHRISGQLDKSATWRMLSMGDSRITDEDIRLYLAVVRQSRDLLTAQYPDIQFEVILWPNQDVPQQRAAYEKIQQGLRQMDIPFVRVEDILPGYQADRSPYILSPTDHHPNALADRMLAQYVVTRLIDQSPD